MRSAFKGVWSKIADDVPSVELNEITKVIGNQQVDKNQNLWEEYDALCEILSETKSFDSKDAYAGGFGKNKIGPSFNPENRNMTFSSLEEVQTHADVIRSSLCSEQRYLEREIDILQRAIDKKAELFMSNSSSNPMSPTTSDDSSLHQKTRTMKTGNLEYSKSEEYLLVPSSTGLINRLCSVCHNRIDLASLSNSNNYTPQQTAPSTNKQQKPSQLLLCILCRENEKKLKSKSTFKAIVSANKKLSSDVYHSMNSLPNISKDSNTNLVTSSLSIISSTSDLSLPLDQLTLKEEYEDSKLDSTARSTSENSKFRKRLQSARDEKYFFDSEDIL